MDRFSLQFQGGHDAALPAGILAAIVLVLLATGAAQALRRRWSSAALCLAAALGPLTLSGALLVLAATRCARDGRGERSALGGAFAVMSAAALGGGAYLLSGSTTMLWLAALALWAAMAVGVFYAAVYAYLGPRRLVALMVLRCLGIVALLLILFKPAMSLTPAGQDDKPCLAILVDRSGSMSVSDRKDLPDRYTQAVGQLNYQRARIAETFHPAWDTFGRSMQMCESLDALASLRPAGEGTDRTNIAEALRAASVQFDRSHLAGILLISDGIHNAPANPEEAATEAAVPVFVAGVGSTSPPPAAGRGIEIVSFEAPLDAVKNNVTTLRVRARGAGGEVPLQCELFEEGRQTPLASDRRNPQKNTGLADFEIKWTPADRAGAPSSKDAPATDVRHLQLVVSPQGTTGAEDSGRVDLHVQVSSPKIRVLYAEGTMRSEYRDLMRLLQTDTNVQFLGLVQVQPRRFLAQGSVEGKTLQGLPVTDADFGLFDVIILGDLDRTYLSNQQVEKFAQFVNKGGGLLMLGGHNSFGPGGYGGTRMEQVLPVVMGSQGQETTPFVPQLTASGMAHPVFEGISGFFAGPGGRKPDASLPPLPELLGCVSVVSGKPAATVLAVHPSRRNEQGPLVVLAVQNFGAGRSAAFTADTTWQWNLQLRAAGKESPYTRFWGQMVRYLANASTKQRLSPTQVLLRPDRTNLQVGQEVQVLARVQDQRGSAAALPRVSCSVVSDDPKASSRSLALSPSQEDKLYRQSWRPDREGRYRLKVTADADGAALGSDEMMLTVAPHAGELDHLARNEALLASIAKRSGGQYMDLSRLPELLDEMTRRLAKAGTGTANPDSAGAGPASTPSRGREIRLYNFTALFLAFAALITAEWVLRRRWQLH